MKRLGIYAMVAMALACASQALAGAGTMLNVNPDGKGDSAPDFTLKEFDTGREVKLSDYKGKKVVMLEFWATWCHICKVEIPNIVKEYNEWKDKGYEVLAITLSDGSPRDLELIRELKEKHKITYPILIDERYEVATQRYKLSGPIPLKLVVDCAGMLRYEHVGDFPEGSEIPFVVDALLAEDSCKK